MYKVQDKAQIFPLCEHCGHIDPDEQNSEVLVYSCVFKRKDLLKKIKKSTKARVSLKSSATIASSSNQHWKFNIIPSKVCTASGFNKFILALHKLSEVFFFKLLPNVFLGREHYVIEHTTVSRGPWESEPSLREAHRNTSESGTCSFFLP